jgi:hypothetical protein
MTASSTPCSCNQIRNRCNSLGSVTNRRRAGFSSGTLHPRQLPSKLSCVRQSPRSSSLPPGGEAAERRRNRLHAVTCYHPSYSEGWRDTDWFKTRVPDQTQQRPHFIQSVNRPAPSKPHERTPKTQRDFHQSVGRGPGKVVQLRRRVGMSPDDLISLLDSGLSMRELLSILVVKDAGES